VSGRILSVHARSEAAVSIGRGWNWFLVWSLLDSALEVFKDSLKNSVSGYCVIIIKMIVSGCFSVDVESFFCIKVPFSWNCIIYITLCIFPKVCICSTRCCVYFEV
jgi:hypothetical protein